MMLIGVLVGIAGLVISIISAVKSVKEWKLINENPDLLKGKGILILALSLDGIYLILLIILFAFITWIFIGYRHGL
jgi:F0F1-type ATP synthase membrane subunit c/vacuolar-type H+-ATPase subunit K